MAKQMGTDLDSGMSPANDSVSIARRFRLAADH